MRYDPTFYAEIEYCSERGIPHSQFLSWSPSDRAKAIAWAQESRRRCSSCGTFDWEWEADQNAYTPMAHTCRGCMMLYAAEEESELQRGSRMVMVPRRRAEEIAQRPNRVRRRE